ncbi:MAG TPA: hypothetical protein VFG51_01225 [Candidatus Saccharimonadia bacterium]|nr:hypothetical protein [Candidatus Saccharimonadia bacterium]
MTQEIIQGLHSCKPGNEPVIGETKTFTVEQKIGKSGKAYLKIKSASGEHGGTPYRILEAAPTGFTDSHGNISFNLGIEPTTLSGGDATNVRVTSTVQSAMPQVVKALPAQNSDGVQETREHLMRSANLLVLCIRAVEKAVAPHQPVVAQTSEQFQSDVAKLFIEASSRRTSDGVNWWSYIDRMPTNPIRATKEEYQPEPF